MSLHPIKALDHVIDEYADYLRTEFRAKDPKLRAVKIDGDWGALQGMVLPQWNPAVHIRPDRPLHPSAYRVFCIDAHTRTPSAAMWAAWEPSGHFRRRNPCHTMGHARGTRRRGFRVWCVAVHLRASSACLTS